MLPYLSLRASMSSSRNYAPYAPSSMNRQHALYDDFSSRSARRRNMHSRMTFIRERLGAGNMFFPIFSRFRRDFLIWCSRRPHEAHGQAFRQGGTTLRRRRIVNMHLWTTLLGVSWHAPEAIWITLFCLIGFCGIWFAIAKNHTAFTYT